MEEMGGMPWVCVAALARVVKEGLSDTSGVCEVEVVVEVELVVGLGLYGLFTLTVGAVVRVG